MMPVGFRKTMCGESKGGKARDRRESAREMARAAGDVTDEFDLSEYEDEIGFDPTDCGCDYVDMPITPEKLRLLFILGMVARFAE